LNVALSRVLRPSSVLATVVLLSLAGCASQRDYLFIVPNLTDIVTSQDPASGYRDAITVGPVSGGKDGSILSIPHISNADFQEALVRTLANAKLARAGNGRFRLDATLQLDQPFISINTTVTAKIAYRLTEVATGAVVYERLVATEGTVTYSEVPSGPERMRYANWRAVRANLRLLVGDLYALPGPATSSPRTLAPRRSCNSAGRWAWVRRERHGQGGRRTWSNALRCGS
jgi:hypothetical protein